MPNDTEKQVTPAYVSYKSLMTFFNGIRDVQHVPACIDRSVMPSFSGATQNEIMGALKFLKMTDNKSEPTALFSEYALADDDARKTMMPSIVRDSYAFVFNTPSFNIERATANQLAELFRSKGVNGSTNSRAISFFLSAAKEAGITMSPQLKAPTIVRNGSSKAKKVKPAAAPTVPAGDKGVENDQRPPPPPGAEVLEIPIPINRKVTLILPPDFKASDWDRFKLMLETYVEGWKAEKSEAGSQKDKGPTPVE